MYVCTVQHKNSTPRIEATLCVFTNFHQPSLTKFFPFLFFPRIGWVFLAGTWILFIIFFFSGLVAYAAYSECDPMEAGLTSKADQIIPFLVMDKLGHLSGLPGLFVAAVYGGVLR